jgi:hypothetical protein
VHKEIEEAARKLGLCLDSIDEASKRTLGNLKEARQAASEALIPTLGPNPEWSKQCLDIVLCGSFGREEVTQQSDFDYLIVAHEVVHDPNLILAFRQAAKKAKKDLGRATPGRTGIFGGLLVSAAEMVDRIGLENDTNADLTHRLLLLEESVPLLNEDRHRKLIYAILKRYLIEYEDSPKRGVPRFLLNDVVRYWRTVAVDYQAKRWLGMDPEKSGLRWFKLRTTRKLAFAGTLIALFWPNLTDQEAEADLLYRQFSMPPLARLAQLHTYLPEASQALEALGNLLKIANSVIQYLDDERVRNTWMTVSDIDEEAKQLTEQLQNNLQILFTSECPLTLSPCQVTLRYLHDRYLVF